MKLYAKCARCGIYAETTPTGDVPDVPQGWERILFCPPLPTVQARRKIVACADCTRLIDQVVAGLVEPAAPPAPEAK